MPLSQPKASPLSWAGSPPNLATPSPMTAAVSSRGTKRPKTRSACAPTSVTRTARGSEGRSKTSTPARPSRKNQKNQPRKIHRYRHRGRDPEPQLGRSERASTTKPRSQLSPPPPVPHFKRESCRNHSTFYTSQVSLKNKPKWVKFMKYNPKRVEKTIYF